MTEFRFFHAADIHLDSQMLGLERDPDVPARRLRDAARDAFRNLIDAAIAERVAFMLIAGDLYDGDWQHWGTGQFLIEQAARLTSAGIPLVMVAGNHDAASVITRHLRLPEGATLLPADRCGRIVLEAPGVAIHGRSFAQRSVTEDLTRDYPAPLPGHFNIGLLHTALNGRPGHDDYAPTTIEALCAKGYDYWALGHVHARELVHEDPWIVFPGNLQGRHVKETGAKGASLVTIRNGRVADIEHRALDVLRWHRLEIPLAGEGDLDGTMARVGRSLGAAVAAAEGRPIAARIILTGATPLHGALLSQAERVRQGVIAEGRQHGADRVWIESVVVDTTAAEGTGFGDRPDALNRLAAVLDELVAEGASELLGDYPERLGERLRQVALPEGHPLSATAPDAAAVLRAARDIVLARLLDEA